MLTFGNVKLTVPMTQTQFQNFYAFAQPKTPYCTTPSARIAVFGCWRGLLSAVFLLNLGRVPFVKSCCRPTFRNTVTQVQIYLLLACGATCFLGLSCYNLPEVLRAVFVKLRLEADGDVVSRLRLTTNVR